MPTVAAVPVRRAGSGAGCDSASTSLFLSLRGFFTLMTPDHPEGLVAPISSASSHFGRDTQSALRIKNWRTLMDPQKTEAKMEILDKTAEFRRAETHRVCDASPVLNA